MKTKMFFLLFVMFTFTAGTLVSAQQTTGKLSFNFQETVKNTNPYLASIAEEAANRHKGIVPTGITEFHSGITRANVDQQSVRDSIAKFQTRLFQKTIAAINSKKQLWAKAGQLTRDIYLQKLNSIEGSIKCGLFDFHGQAGQMYGTTWSGANLASGYGLVDHASLELVPCFYFDFGSDGIYPFKAQSCFNPFPDDLVFAVMNHTAELVVNDPSAQGPGPRNAGPRNTGTAGTGGTKEGSLTFEQLLVLAEVWRQPVIVNAGNNNGNNNGGSGGQGGSVTGQSGSVSPLQTTRTTPVHTTGPRYTDPQGDVWVSTNTTTQTTQPNRVASVPLTETQQSSQQPNVMYTQAPCNGCGTGVYDRRTARATTAAAVGTFVGPILGAGFGKLLDYFIPTGGNSTNNYYSTNSSSTTTTDGGPSDMPNGLWQ